MIKKVSPLVGRAAELHEHATSDLSVEEQLSSGASVNDLIAADVLYDDYDPDNDPAYSFTPTPTAEEIERREADISESSPISSAEFQAQMEDYFKHGRMAAEYRKNANQRATWT